MSTTIASFLKYVLPDVPGCPSAVATDAVRRATQEFLTRSQAWSDIQDALPVGTNAQEYDLEAPTGARCIDVRAIYTLSGELVPVTMSDLARILPTWQTAEGSVPVYYTRAFDFTTFRVYPKPTDPGSERLRVHAVYTLKDDATTIPDDIVQRYRDVIAAGAKARLMLMPKASWQDLQLAAFHEGKFEIGISMALISAAQGKTTLSVAVRPRRFGQ